MEDILIIKTGAAGDVVRTTSLLNVLKGNIYWVTAHKYKSLLPEDVPALRVLTIQEAFKLSKNVRFSQVISLEEDYDCALLAAKANKDHLAGLYSDNGKINYTDNSANWFDMSKVSRLKRIEANKLKMKNTLSYQHHIFQMIGKRFAGEPYRVFTNKSINTNDKLIGIEKRAGRQWPNKHWTGYGRLIEKLSEKGWQLRVFEERSDLREYMQDIAECSHIVSGDTLAMHIALAYEKTCTAIFNCTSPQEIYDYGLMKKVVSPALKKYFYKTTFDEAVIESVSVDEVFNAISLSIE